MLDQLLKFFVVFFVVVEPLSLIPLFNGLTDGASDETKARYAFVMGDFRRIHRSGIIACHYRAAEWRHKAIELAAHELLQYLDRAAGIT